MPRLDSMVTGTPETSQGTRISGFPNRLKKTADFARGAQKKEETPTETNGKKTKERKTPRETRPATTPWRRATKLGPREEPKDANSATSQEGLG
ncbi:hypothetical protein NDU88_005870 [Pleurodeles waltl]|uniref:Uncharacterized protein n=1 Tax=Pleurodeles waltl TaxID=8319 RepID=A0AAV7UKR2_PLEWA|nr:hypothetical protein NDU88_005870 [Pleurodeles waltl]